MSTEASLLPMDFSTLLSQKEVTESQDDLQDDPFLQELINNQKGDFFSSLFEVPEDRSSDILGAPLDLESLMALPTSSATTTTTTLSSGRSDDGGNSETSSISHQHDLSSPTGSLASTRGSIYDHQSPSSSPLVTTTFTDIPMQLQVGVVEEELDVGRWSSSPPSDWNDTPPVSSDIRIDVDYMVSMRESTSPTNSSTSERKAATLYLTDEEKKLLLEEGITLPTDMPLTKAEQKHLKRIQRKIKNKISAQESRKRKKGYIDSLEDRIKLSTQKNQELGKEVDRLQTHNFSLSKQLRELQQLVNQFLPSKVQAGTAGTILMVVALSFSLFLVPNSGGKGAFNYQNGYNRRARTLLFTETDEYGNIIDPNSGSILSVAGGHTPLPLPPWLDQTPVISDWMNTTIAAPAQDSAHKEKGRGETDNSTPQTQTDSNNKS